MICATCNLKFDDITTHKAHYKEEIHDFNLKRKLVNLPPL